MAGNCYFSYFAGAGEMREIKFRLYDKDNAAMFDWVWVKDNPEIIVSGLMNQKLMQYTGLKDKNGVEIYEGDILEWRVFNGANIFEVKFLYGGFKATQPNGYIEDLYYFIEAVTEGNKITVIGNIYENKELLED